MTTWLKTGLNQSCLQKDNRTLQQFRHRLILRMIPNLESAAIKGSLQIGIGRNYLFDDFQESTNTFCAATEYNSGPYYIF